MEEAMATGSVMMEIKSKKAMGFRKREVGVVFCFVGGCEQKEIKDHAA